MFSLCHIILLLSVCSVPGLILPVTKPDGTLDVPSLLSHIALMEQSIKNMASAAEVEQLKSDLAASQKALTVAQTKLKGGATFTRWGRTSCPVDNKLIYKGYTAGTYYTDKASAATILCLPDQPIYANHSDAANTYVSHIFGTEYDDFYPGSPFNGKRDEDMPCAVCEINTRSSAIMVPARNQCYPGWTLEYSGYLMGPYSGYASGEYICVDADAETIPGGQADRNGQVLFSVQGKCGSLGCPPYHNNWELTCAVCSK